MPEGIIVADDDVLMRGILRSILVGVGQTVFLAANGEEVLALGASVSARLVMLDLHMPRLNGLLTCERLRQLPGYAQTPIVVLSALESPSARQAASVVGATLYLAKPFQPAALIQTISPYLGLSQSAMQEITRAGHRAREIAAPYTRPSFRQVSL